MLDILVTIFSNYLLQISRGFGKNVNYSIACFITGLTTIIFNFLFILHFKFGAISILYSSILGNLICCIYLFFSLEVFNYISTRYIDFKKNKEILKYSMPLIPNFFSWWVVSVSDRTIITKIMGTSFNGIYAAATKFPSIITSLFSIFSLSWTESASIHINDDDKNEFFSNVANSVVNIFSCFSALLISVIPIVFNFFIKAEYFEAYYQIPILIIGSFFNCIVLVYSAIYIAKKLTKQVALTSLFSAIINIFINILFIKKIGLYAASISTVIAYFSMTIYRHYDSKKYVDIRYDSKNILKSVLMISFSIICYFINSIIIHFTSVILILIISIYLNRNIIMNSLNKIIKKTNFNN